VETLEVLASERVDAVVLAIRMRAWTA